MQIFTFFISAIAIAILVIGCATFHGIVSRESIDYIVNLSILRGVATSRNREAVELLILNCAEFPQFLKALKSRDEELAFSLGDTIARKVRNKLLAVD